jgi:hypothetical protein
VHVIPIVASIARQNKIENTIGKTSLLSWFMLLALFFISFLFILPIYSVRG